MITIYPFEDLGHVNHGWLDARHHFSFASYFNPKRHHFGALRVVNDDIIKAGAGFDTHPHEDMEILTYIRRGAITHKDSQGNEGRIVAGDLQVMSAGTGIFHSEFNLESEDTQLYQIWIYPKTKGVTPKWASQSFPTEPVRDSLHLLASGDGKAPLHIHQDAWIYGGNLTAGTRLIHGIHDQAYVLISKGLIEIDGQSLKQGDAAEITDTAKVSITANADAEILVLDVPRV
jgi:redox-sensitive bicupin YhaK (pirin superfamily)